MYLHGTGAPFRKEGCALCYRIYSIWRRHLLLLILDIKRSPNTSKGKDNEVMVPTPFLLDSQEDFHISIFYKWSL